MSPDPDRRRAFGSPKVRRETLAGSTVSVADAVSNCAQNFRATVTHFERRWLPEAALSAVPTRSRRRPFPSSHVAAATSGAHIERPLQRLQDILAAIHSKAFDCLVLRLDTVIGLN